jgi:uncharacterized protein (DUF302 family)
MKEKEDDSLSIPCRFLVDSLSTGVRWCISDDAWEQQYRTELKSHITEGIQTVQSHIE